MGGGVDEAFGSARARRPMRVNVGREHAAPPVALEERVATREARDGISGLDLGRFTDELRMAELVPAKA